MKKYKKLQQIIFLSFVGILINSCVKSDDFSLPDVSITEPNITANTTFKAVKERFKQQGWKEEPLYIVGYIVSTDKAGNFYKHMVIQNRKEDRLDINNPRMGLGIELNATSLYEKYDIGRKIYIKLNGLSVGKSHGVLVIGKVTNNKISRIPTNEIDKVIFRSSEIETILPKIVTIETIVDNDTNTLIQLESMQFITSDLSKTYAGESNDSYMGERILESCNNRDSILLSSSVYSDFKSIIVAQGQGTIMGVLTNNFLGDTPTILIRDRDDIVFNQDRCPPLF